MAIESSSSWTEVLKVLPARDRLAWQKQISADTAAQVTQAKQGPFSRAYASGGPQAKPSPTLFVDSSTTRCLSSSAEFLAVGLHKAFIKAKVPLPADLSTAGPEDPLVDSLRAAGLDAAYSIAVCKSLQRRLASDLDWATERPSGRFAAAATLADGSLLAAVQASRDTAAAAAAAASASRGPSGASMQPTPTLRTPVQGDVVHQRQDDMLDSALDELLSGM
jgi:hypothetical protein